MQTAIKERPILFSGQMVRAILGGRKTVTRRVVNPQPKTNLGYMDVHGSPGVAIQCGEDYPDNDDDIIACPYGRPGDRLWVREAHSFSGASFPLCGSVANCNSASHDARIWYRVDNDRPTWAETRWRPSIHMPRWASRITLEVVDIRVERLQDITESEAIVEGLSGVAEFAELWDELNAGRGFPWYSQPWVWRVEFHQLTEDQP